MAKLPKDANIGDIVEKKITIHGKNGKPNRHRMMSYEKVKKHGKNKNLSWKFIKNESESEYKKRKERERRKKNKK